MEPLPHLPHRASSSPKEDVPRGPGRVHSTFPVARPCGADPRLQGHLDRPLQALCPPSFPWSQQPDCRQA